MVFSAVYAQNAGDINLGGRAGMLFGFHRISYDLPMNLSAFPVSIPDLLSERSLNNFSLALYGSYTLINNLSIQVELNYIRNQGIEFTGPLGVSLRGTISTLDIPILVKYSFLNTNVRIGIFGGLYLCIPVSDFEATVSLPVFGSTTFRYNLDGATYGFTVGASAGLPAGPGRIVGDIRYIRDLPNAQIQMYGITIDTIGRQGLSISVGYEINLRSR